MKFRILLFVLLAFVACKKNTEEIERIPLAKVHDKFLFDTDMEGLFIANTTKEDSIIIAKNFIDDWVKKQLLLDKAELNLIEGDKDIEKQVQDYRSSLLIFKYKQGLISQKLDTVVTDQEIEKYYNGYSGNFVLNHNIVKVLFLVISKEAPDIEKVKRWYKSSKVEDRSKLEGYCYQYATKYDDFNNEWIPFNKLLMELPIIIEDQERHLKYNEYIETQDDLYHYFVKINGYSLKSTIQPLEYAREKIKSIILNKRKFTFIEELENRVYNDALNHNEFIIY